MSTFRVFFLGGTTLDVDAHDVGDAFTTSAVRSGETVVAVVDHMLTEEHGLGDASHALGSFIAAD